MIAAPARPSRYEANYAWAKKEFGHVNFGDKRLAKRFIKILAAFLSLPQASIPQAIKEWNDIKATYNFFDHDGIVIDRIFEEHRKSCVERARNEAVVLVIQDSSLIDHTRHPGTKGLGPLTNLDHRGFVLHPSLIITPNQVPLGILDPQIWVRRKKGFGRSSKDCKKKTVAQKESKKWLSSLAATENFSHELGSDTMVVNMGDREADVYEDLEFACEEGRRSYFLVRAQADRCLWNSDQYLWEHMEEQPVVETMVVKVHPKLVKKRNGNKKKNRKNKKLKGKLSKNRKGRTATVSVRYATATLNVPCSRRKSEGHKPVTINVVYVKEENPPKGEEAISWMLLTTVPVNSKEDALKIVRWYACRWMIEILFKVLKSGCKAEERQLETAERLKRCLVTDLIVAYRILYLTMVGRKMPDLPCTVVFEGYEWKALYVYIRKSSPNRLPEKEPTLGEMTRDIARLGGFIGRKHDGDPGPITMWRGLQRLFDIAAMWVICFGSG